MKEKKTKNPPHRPLKYGEKTVRIVRQVPISKIKEYEAMIDAYLKKLLVKK